jgi:hypothetical protein
MPPLGSKPSDSSYLNSIVTFLKDRNTKVLAALIVLLHLAGFVYKVFDGNLYMDDSIEYLYMAENISNEGIFIAVTFQNP